MINNCWFCLDEQDDPCSGCSSCGKYSMLFIVTKIKIFIVSKILQLILIKNAKAVKYFQISKETMSRDFRPSFYDLYEYSTCTNLGAHCSIRLWKE